MLAKIRKAPLTGLWVHGILSLAALLFFLLLQIVFSFSDDPILSYLLYFATQLFSVLSPAVTFAFLFLFAQNKGIGKCVLYTLLITLPDLLSFGTSALLSASFRYTVGGALLIGLTEGALAVFLHAGEALLMFITAAVVLKIRRGKFRPVLGNHSAFFNLSEPEALAVFLACLLPCFILLVREIVNTVSYLIEYRGGYETGEILFMMGCYFAIVAEWVISYASTVKIIEKCSENSKKERSREDIAK